MLASQFTIRRAFVPPLTAAPETVPDLSIAPEINPAALHDLSHWTTRLRVT